MNIKDYPCSADRSPGPDREALQRLGLHFPDAYLHSETMAKLSMVLKDYEHSPFCTLPFCHTVEAEAMGGIINYGNEVAGPRAKEYICTTLDELADLPEMDFSSGRIREVLLACSLLREQGEHVLLQFSGPFTIMNVLIDAKQIYKGLRKDPALMKKLFWKFGDEIFKFMEEAKKYGADLLCYADPPGGVNILGPKMAEQVVNDFTHAFLKKAECLADSSTLLLLCPKTTFALLGTEKAKFTDAPLTAPMTYGEACIRMIGKAKFAGQMCPARANAIINDGIFREVVLT